MTASPQYVEAQGRARPNNLWAEAVPAGIDAVAPTSVGLTKPAKTVVCCSDDAPVNDWLAPMSCPPTVVCGTSLPGERIVGSNEDAVSGRQRGL